MKCSEGEIFAVCQFSYCALHYDDDNNVENYMTNDACL